MRATRSPEEVEALGAITQYLREQGFGDPEEIEEIHDKPDSAFKTSKGRVACEFASIVPDTVLRCYHKEYPNLPVGHLVEFILPREPHEWIRNIVSKKTKLHHTYVTRGGTENVWLLLYTLKGTSGILSPPTEDDMRLMAHGANSTKHDFRRILYYNGDSVRELFRRKQRVTSRVNYNLAKGYPTIALQSFSAGKIARVIPGGYGRLELLPALLPVAKRVIVPPLDERFAAVPPNLEHDLKPVVLAVGAPSPNGTLIPPEQLFPEMAEVLEQYAQEVARRASK